MLFKYIILPFLLLIPAGVYLYFYLLRTAYFWMKIHKGRKVKLLAALLAFCLSLWSLNMFGFGALVVLHIIAAAICMEIINLFLAALHKHRGTKTGLWKRLYCCGLIPLVITVLILGYGYINMGNIVETHHTINTDKAIRQQGYRIAMISDLHFGTTMNEEKLKKYCNEIEEKNPDLVVLCGDIVDEKTDLLQMKNAARILGNIKSSYGIFYVYGNHDKNTYTSMPEYNEEQLKRELESNGVYVLQDEIYNINDELTIIGRRDKGFSSEYKRKTCEDLLKNVDTGNFLLLLDHQPGELKENSRVGIDLQLSGHTHGGQIWPVGILNEIAGSYQLNYGYKKINDYQIIVSSGIGGWGYPIRTGSHSEYVIVDVKR